MSGYTQEKSHINVVIVIKLFFNKNLFSNTYHDTHWGETYKCSHCDKAFSNKSNLITHLKMHLHFNFTYIYLKNISEITNYIFL